MVEFITYEGKKYPVKVGYFALMMAQQETKIASSSNDIKDDDIKDDDVSILSYDYFTSVLYYSLQLGAEATNTKSKISKKEARFVLNECFADFMKIFYSFTMKMAKTQDTDEIQVQGGTDESKK